MIPKEQKIQELQSLLRQDKFLAEKEGLYTGVANDQLRGVLTDTVNISIHSFISITEANGSDEDYRKAIAEGLASLESIKSVIDTEDNERVAGTSLLRRI